jgi:hypothetical protein
MEEIHELLLSDLSLNKKFYESEHCKDKGLLKLQYEIISRPRGITEDTYVQTTCGITAAMIMYILSGTTDIASDNHTASWVGYEYNEGGRPLSDTLYVVGDGGDHEFIIHKGYVFDSWWNTHSLSIRKVPEDLLSNLREGTPISFVSKTGTVFHYDYYQIAELKSETNIEDIRQRIGQL